MHIRKFMAVGLIFILLPALCLGQEFGKAEYMKPGPDSKKKGEVVKGTLHLDKTAKEIRFVGEKNTAPEFAIKHDAIKSMLYERSAKPRYAAGLLVAWPLLFTKSKSHYLTVQYTDASGAGQYAIIKLHKGNYRDALAVLEAETGKKIERAEER